MYARDLTRAHEVWSCSETSSAQEVAKLMAEHHVGSIPVLDPQGRLEGIVTDRDLCCRLIAEGGSFQTPIREFMSEPAHFVYPDTSLPDIESIMRRYKVRRLPVVNEERKLLGFIAISDLARHCASPEEEHELVGVLETVGAPGEPEF